MHALYAKVVEIPQDAHKNHPEIEVKRPSVEPRGAFLRLKGGKWRIITFDRFGGQGMKRAWGRARAAIALGLVIAVVNTAVAQAVEIISSSATYIVTVDGDFNDVVRGQLRDAGVTIDDEFEYAFDGFVVELSDYQLPYVQSLEYVKAIEEDAIVTVAATQSPTPSWGLDRIDQRARSASGAI